MPAEEDVGKALTGVKSLRRVADERGFEIEAAGDPPVIDTYDAWAEAA